MSKCRGVPAGYYDDDRCDHDDIFGCDCSSSDNLKIKVIPDITANAGLNGENFDSELTDKEASFFSLFKASYTGYKRHHSSEMDLRVLYWRHSDPLLLALKLFANSPGRTNLRSKTIAVFVLETVCEMHKQKPSIGDTCDDNMRMVAFNFIKTCGIVSLCKAVILAYDLRKIKDLLVPKIRELIAEGYYKDASYWAIYLEVAPVFSIFDIAVPLILQDKLYLAEEYLNVVKEQQLTIVRFLDSLIENKKTVKQQCDEVLDKYKYTDIKHNILSYRPMSKLLTRLAKKYEIDPHFTPNLNFAKSSSHLHYLYHKYNEKGINTESWKEMVCDFATTKELQWDLVIKIASLANHDEAVYWAKHFKLPIEDCPSHLKNKLMNQTKTLRNEKKTLDTVDCSPSPSDLSNVKSNTISEQQEYLKLDLDYENIIMVDNKEKFLDMVRVLSNYNMIAFDSEWKPSFCKDNIVSVLQMAIPHRVYLLDCLSNEITEELWKLLGMRIFNNMEILKVGFSLRHDLTMLQKSLPLQLDLEAATCYLDLSHMWRRMKCMPFVEFPFARNVPSGESLAVLTELCLGKKLDKSNQCSNWANRPLRYDQVIYAALDAYCLLQIYQVMFEILWRKSVDIDKVVEEITSETHLYRMKRTPSEKFRTKKFNKNNKCVEKYNSMKGCNNSVENIKFICDDLFCGLSKEMRKIGIDCIDMKYQDNSYYIGLAKRENRYVLTIKERRLQFMKKLPEKQCISIKADTTIAQLQYILGYFNIILYERNLFSRCLHCNSNVFILAGQEEMQLLRFGEIQQEPKTNLGSINKNRIKKTFQLKDITDHVISTKCTFRGNPIKSCRVKYRILSTVEHFFICDNCGICTWENSYSVNSSILNLVEKDACSKYYLAPL